MRIGSRFFSPRDFRRILADGPAQAALDEFVKAGVAPGPLVVAPGGVEDAALPLRADPGPRLLDVPLGTVFEDGAVRLVVLRVDVGLVPAREALVPLHDRVVRRGDCGGEGAGAVAAELGADEGDVLRRVEEAVAGAVQRDEALTTLDEVEQCLLLLRSDPGDVREDHERVVAGEGLLVQVGGPVGVGQLDAAFGEHRLELLEPLRRAVAGIVAEEEDLERFWLLGGEGRGQPECEDQDSESEHEIVPGKGDAVR